MSAALFFSSFLFPLRFFVAIVACAAYRVVVVEVDSLSRVTRQPGTGEWAGKKSRHQSDYKLHAGVL